MKQYSLVKSSLQEMKNLPTPSSITLNWNFGSLLATCLTIQIMTGIMLAMHYTNNTTEAFNSIISITRNVCYGWVTQSIHANGASLFFLCLYSHVGRGIYYMSFKLTSVWLTGILILLTSMVTAFLGYVLPWGQMSFWGATVITNLLSATPWVGNDLVKWLWGGYAVDNPTLSRFFSMHFLFPFIMMGMIITHLMALHQTGSSNPLGLKLNNDKIPFHPFFTLKDTMGAVILSLLLGMMVMYEPQLFSEPENFNHANAMVTPTHIQPEWYFLFAYSILRSIPNKLGGIIMMIMSIIILSSFLFYKSKFQTITFYPLNQNLYWTFLTSTILLTWTGMRLAESPFMSISQVMTLIYFSYFIINPLILKIWDKLTDLQ